VTRTLLRRWGVIFWRLLAREAEWLPSWRDFCCVAAAWKRARDPGRAVRGGLLGRAVRKSGGRGPAARRAPPVRHGQYLSLSGADPLNLVGIGRRARGCPAHGNRLLYLDGLRGDVAAAPSRSWNASNPRPSAGATALLRRYGPRNRPRERDIEPAPARE